VEILKSYAQTDFGQVHYLKSGSPGKPPLVLLHQCPSSSEMYRNLMGFLGRDFVVYAPDLPGFGGSEQILDQISVKGLASVMASFMKAIELPACTVFGHHTGASVAVQLACSFPEQVDKLILSGPPCLSKDEQARFRSLLVKPYAMDEDGDYILHAWQKLRSKGKDISLEISHRELTLSLVAGELVSEVYSAVFSHNMPDLLKRLDQPTLVVAGREDVMFPYMASAMASLKQGKMISIGDACGYVCETHTRDLANIIFEFWRAAPEVLKAERPEPSGQGFRIQKGS
jgi:pimeloyl-ACP methyl ester carboxylesterase